MTDEAERIAAFNARKIEAEVPERIRTFVRQLGIADKLEEVFGHGTTMFDLKLCKHSLDTCGCSREFMWSRVSPGDDRREVPVNTPDTCEHHQNLPMHDHHAILVAESRHRQHVRHDILSKMPPKYRVTHGEGDNATEDFKHQPTLEYDADRELVVTLNGLGLDLEAVHAQVKQHLDKKHVTRRVKMPKPR